MRIGIDARFFGPDSKGLGRYTQKLVTHLENIDQKNEYVIFLRKSNFDFYVPKNSRFIKVLADYQWYSFGEQFLFPFVLYKSRCDLVHFLHFNVPIFYFKKFIVTIHDLILLRYPTRRATTRNAIFYWCKFFLYRVVIASAMLRSQLIIAVSKFTKKDICVQYSYACKKIFVVYEAAEITVQNVDLTSEDVLNECGIMGKYMLYVGNAYPHKNLYSLVDAFGVYAQGDNIVKNLVLVGKDDHFYRELENYITSQRIENIIILHTVNDNILEVLYRKATLFVFPSLYEGFGLPPLEAQLYGVPVISSNHACMREILSVDGARYCDTGDQEDFVHAMQEVSSDKKLREKLISRGKKNVERFSWKKMANQIYNIYKIV